MPGQDWFYRADTKIHGPIPGASLKQLADRGVLSPETPIRREDMAEWVQARAVKGLFPSSPPPPAPTPAPPARATPPASGGWHPLDVLISATRDAVPEELPQQISRLASIIGITTLYIAAVLIPIGGLLLAIRTNRFGAVAFGVGAGVAIIVLQYVAQRLLAALETTINSNKSFLSSLAIPDCTFVLISTSTVGAVIALIASAISAGMLTPAIGAVVVLAAGVFASLVAVQPAGLSVVTKSGCRAAEDAVGVLTFIVKMLLRCAPIVFAATVLFGTYRVAESLINILRADKAVVAFVGINDSLTAVGILTAAAAVPVYAYFVMLIYYLTLDVISAIVSMPAKLDIIANGNGRHTGGEE